MREKEGQKEAVESLEEFYHNVAVLLLNTTVTLDPELILLGGGISDNQEIIQKNIFTAENLLKTIPEINNLSPPCDKSMFRRKQRRCYWRGCSIFKTKSYNEEKKQMNTMEKYIDKIFGPVALFMNNSLFFRALTDSFMKMTPLTLGAAVLMVVRPSSPIPSWMAWLSETGRI